MAKWEYLRVAVNINSGGGSHLTPNGIKVIDGAGEQSLLASGKPAEGKAIMTALLNKLGIEGWELVGIAPGGSEFEHFAQAPQKHYPEIPAVSPQCATLYFKRPS